jgi:hypothetical protein
VGGVDGDIPSTGLLKVNESDPDWLGEYGSMLKFGGGGTGTFGELSGIETPS